MWKLTLHQILMLLLPSGTNLDTSNTKTVLNSRARTLNCPQFSGEDTYLSSNLGRGHLTVLNSLARTLNCPQFSARTLNCPLFSGEDAIKNYSLA